MAVHRSISGLLLTTVVLALVCCLGAPLADARDKDTVWNFDGGVFMDTEGGLPNGICFHLKGRVTSGHFFDDLKRIDRIGAETIFQRGKEAVTEFPDHLLLEFTLYDMPCSPKLQATGSRTYLTRAMVGELHLALFWKRGLELRPLLDFKPVNFSVRPIFPYNPEATDVPEKLEWNYALAVNSAGVPITDSLVMVIRTSDGHVAARVAARL